MFNRIEVRFAEKYRTYVLWEVAELDGCLTRQRILGLLYVMKTTAILLEKKHVQ